MRKNSVFLCPYHVGTPTELNNRNGMTSVARAATDAIVEQRWLYDLGDDPAFLSAEYFGNQGGALTWGICRRNVRNRVREGDVVCFFGFEKDEDVTKYYFSGYATVSAKVSQQDLWEIEDLAVLRPYLNVMIAPSDDGYAHREMHPGNNHPDWLWRMVERNRAWTSKDFAAFEDASCSKSFRPGVDRTSQGVLIEMGKNYVIFATPEEETFLLEEPHLVAEHHRGASTIPELWFADTVSAEVRSLTLGGLDHIRALRTSDVWYQHTFARFDTDVAAWRQAMVTTLKKAGLRARSSH